MIARTLTITVNVSDFTDDQIASLAGNMTVQCERWQDSNDERWNYPTATVLTVEVSA